MIQSMTGFGRGGASDENYKLEIEMKSVNHRYLDVSMRIPRKLNFLETAIRSSMKEYVSRGKIDVFVTLSDLTGGNTAVTYNRGVAEAYLSGIRRMSRDLLLEDTTVAYQISRFPEVFTMEEPSLDEKEVSALVTEALRQAGSQLVASREAEGSGLQEDLLQKLDKISSLVDAVVARAPEIIREYRQKIRDKVTEMLGDTGKKLDEGVLATELVVYADRVCVDEELVRLRTHIVHMRETLKGEGAVGRKLDFLTQEMNREANTILSKANDIEVSNYGIELKTEIEKIREQIQNIE